MRKSVGLFEKRMLNRRFKRTEEAILAVFFQEGEEICAGEMAKRVGVARSTIHSHHRSMRDIIPNYERYILRKYRRMIRKMMKNQNARLKFLYFKTIFFIVQDKNVFGLLIKNERRVFIEKMLMEMKEKMINYMKLPKNSEKILKVYISEVTILIEDWGKRGFIEEEIEKLLSEVMFLSDTGKMRLGSLRETKN